MYLPALPDIVKYFNTTNSLGQLSITLWFLGTAALFMFMGPLSDRYGRRPIMFSNGVLYVLASLGCAATSDYHTFLVFIFLQGASICAISIAGYAAINEIYTRIESVKIMSLMAGITVSSPAFGPLIGGILLNFVEWKTLFILIAITSSVALVLLFFYMPDQNEKKLLLIFLYSFRIVVFY